MISDSRITHLIYWFAAISESQSELTLLEISLASVRRRIDRKNSRKQTFVGPAVNAYL